MEPRSYVATMLAGAAAGALPRILTHPLDTCKARIQVRTPSASAKLRGGLIAELVHSARSEGVRSLYRGFPTAFWGAAPAGCLYFGCYEACKDALSPYVGPAGSGSAATAHLLAGLVAEAASCVLWVPIDVVKERLQVQSTLWKEAGAGTANANAGGAPPRGKSMLLYRGNVDAFASIISNEGVRGLYRGYGATLLSFGPFSAIFFMLNEQFKAAWVRWSGLDLQGKGPEALRYPTLCFLRRRRRLDRCFRHKPNGHGEAAPASPARRDCGKRGKCRGEHCSCECERNCEQRNCLLHHLLHLLASVQKSIGRHDPDRAKRRGGGAL